MAQALVLCPEKKTSEKISQWLGKRVLADFFYFYPDQVRFSCDTSIRLISLVKPDIQIGMTQRMHYS